MLDNNTGKMSEPISLKQQRAIFKFAEFEQVELAVALEHFGYSLNNLIYDNSSKHILSSSPPRHLNDFKVIKHQIPFVSFFSGCGGIDLGFETAGFEHLAAFEFNELFCKTLRKNRPEWEVFGPPTESGDVSKIPEVIETLGGNNPGQLRRYLCRRTTMSTILNCC